jgi:hypothetical protein
MRTRSERAFSSKGMYTESLPESHQSLTSLDPFLCYTLHVLEGSRPSRKTGPRIEMEVERWPRPIALVVTP